MTTTSTTQQGAVLALDAGQTGIRARLVDAGAAAPAPELEFPGVLTDRPVLPQLAQVAAEALRRSGTGADTLAVGSSGLTDDMSAEALLALVEQADISRVLLAHDSVTSHLGALDGGTGAVVAAGTGVVTLAVGEHDVARVDGWGHLLGDAGSGYWIGRAALEAVMRAHDGRGPATALSAPARREFPDLESAYMELQADEHRVRRIAAWARTVAELDAAGDQVCHAIGEQAGAELACSALAGLQRVGEDRREDPAVATTGKVFCSPTVAASFEAHVRRRHPGARIVRARGTSLDGAARMALLEASSALRSRIRVADRAQSRGE